MDDDGWVEGGGIINFRWPSAGNELLIQRDEQFVLYDIKGKLTELRREDRDFREVARWGHKNDGWWFILKEQGQVRFQRGFEGEPVVLDQVTPQEITCPTLSPDGRTVAGVVSKLTLACWAVNNGKKILDMKIEIPIGPDDDIFGEPELYDLEWSKNSAYLAMGAPTVGLMIVDVKNRSIHGVIG